MIKKYPIIWLTGNSGAGKSTAAFAVQKMINYELETEEDFARRMVILDGDEMRATVSVGEGFTKADRTRHNQRVARLARLLRESGFLVVVTVIAPFEDVRKQLEEICNPIWVYIKREVHHEDDRPYEPPENPAYIIDNDKCSIEEAQAQLFTFIKTTLAKEFHI